jgi:prenyltransferase beta subunit
MTGLSEEMIKALKRSREKLSNEALDIIREFLKSSQHPDGGFTDRAGNQDPYYSVFGYFLAFAFDLEIQSETQKQFIESWKDNHTIDLIHAVSLMQCAILIEAHDIKNKNKKLSKIFSTSDLIASLIKAKLVKRVKAQHTDLLDIIERYRSNDGSFNHLKEKMAIGNIYATFLVWSLYQDLEINKRKNSDIFSCLSNLQLSDGSFVNVRSSSEGITSATSAGLIMQMAKGDSPISSSVSWLKNRFNSYGGCTLGENIPIADVLSTATALLALKIAGEPILDIASKTSDFINLHWDESGGFFGSIADMKADCEYSYYALLALGLI